MASSSSSFHYLVDLIIMTIITLPLQPFLSLCLNQLNIHPKYVPNQFPCHCQLNLKRR